jgi:Holliday junction resolvase-like predicted endonuclease
MVFVEGDDYRQLRRPGDDPAQFRSVVRPGQKTVIPSSVIHQYRGENFTTSTWLDSALNGPQVDLLVNGPSTSTLGPNADKAASADGADDLALSTAPAGDGPESLPNNEKFAVATVLKGPQANNKDIIGFFDGTNAFELNQRAVFDNSAGEIQLVLNDGSNVLRVESKASATQAFDSNSHLVVAQKTGPTSSDVEIYIDDMTTDIATVNTAGTFDETAYAANEEMALFALNNQGSIRNFKQSTASLFEFNKEAYSPSELQDLKKRAPGI